ELREWALTVNPFDIQQQADTIYQALTMHATERQQRIEGLRGQVREHDITRWIDAQLSDLAALRPVEAGSRASTTCRWRRRRAARQRRPRSTVGYWEWRGWPSRSRWRRGAAAGLAPRRT